MTLPADLPDPHPGTPGGKTPAGPPDEAPPVNREGEPFGQEGTNKTLPEPAEPTPKRPRALPETGKDVGKTPYVR